MDRLTLKQEYEGFKKIDYTLISDKSLKELHNLICEQFIKYDSEDNSYFFSTGIRDFDLLLEEFDIYVCDKLEDLKKWN